MTLLRYVTEIAAVNQALLVVCLRFSMPLHMDWRAACATHYRQSPMPDPRRDAEASELLIW